MKKIAFLMLFAAAAAPCAAQDSKESRHENQVLEKMERQAENENAKALRAARELINELVDKARGSLLSTEGGLRGSIAEGQSILDAVDDWVKNHPESALKINSAYERDAAGVLAKLQEAAAKVAESRGDMTSMITARSRAVSLLDQLAAFSKTLPVITPERKRQLEDRLERNDFTHHPKWH